MCTARFLIISTMIPPDFSVFAAISLIFVVLNDIYCHWADNHVIPHRMVDNCGDPRLHACADVSV